MGKQAATSAVPTKPWKYAVELALHADCPPQKLSCIDATVFRFSHKAITASNFLPVAVMPGARLPGTKTCCTEYSLSFFETADKAAERLKQICTQQPQFHKRCGGCIAAVVVTKNDGEATKPSKNSRHFELFEYKSATLEKRATFEREVIT